jgi:hydrogenase maturation protease
VTRHTRVIGLGNTLLSDDGVGVYAAREIHRRLDGQFPEVDIVESEVAGFALLELMEGWERIILIDAVAFDGIEPGEVFRIHPQDLRTSLRIRSVHEIDLPTALELGRRLGMGMPDEVLIFAVQTQDCLTFGERLNEPVKAACARAVDMVVDEIGCTGDEVGRQLLDGSNEHVLRAACDGQPGATNGSGPPNRCGAQPWRSECTRSR